MRRIAAALSGNGSARTGPLYLSAPPGVPVRVRRQGGVLSTWEVRHALPGRVRLRHPCLRRRRGFADAVLEELAGVPGVLDCRVGLYTGSLLVCHDVRRLGRDELLRLCEAALHKAEVRSTDLPGPARFGVGSTLLALAVAGHFAYPPLLVVCAALLVAANVETFGRAWNALRARIVDVDVLYGTLIALTLLAGDFLAVAFMAWCMAAWPLLLDRRLAATRRALAADRRLLPRLVPVRRDGLDVMAPAAARRAGDLAIVEAGGVLPADGVVREGAASVDERRITGEAGAADKAPGQPVYAGARVLAGRLVIEVTRAERAAVATEVRRRLLEAARVPPPDATPGDALARRVAPPALALSAVGALTGGLGTAIAVLAPNYSAAPRLASPLDRCATLLRCAEAGFLVRDEAALVRLAGVDAVVIDASTGEPEAWALVDGLRDRGIEQILLVSAASAAETARLAARIGNPAPVPGLDPAGRARLLRRLRQDGLTVAFVGCGDDRAAAREADVVIALGGPHLPAADAADVVLVAARLARTLDLVDLARMHVREARVSRHLGLWPNLLAVGGAFMVGFLGLHSVLLSNLGALAVYVRGSGRLAEAEAAWRAQQP